MKGKPICLLVSYQKVKFSRFPSLELAPMTSILKRVGIERPFLGKENSFYAAWLLKMRTILLWNVTHFQHIDILFFDDLEEIVPSFSSKNVDEKFSFKMECKDYDLPVYALQISV